MFKLMGRWWAYLTAKLSGSFEERADPKVQLEQAIAEAQDQHRRLTEQAANVIAHQKQTEMRLNRSMSELEKLNGSTRQAVTMADKAAKSGRRHQGRRVRQDGRGLRQPPHLRRAAGRSPPSSSCSRPRRRPTRPRPPSARTPWSCRRSWPTARSSWASSTRPRCRSRSTARWPSLNEAVGQDVPTLDQVRDKIEARYAKALGTQELTGNSVEARMLEVEQAQVNNEAQARLAEIRSQLGLGPSPEELPIEQVSGDAVGPGEAQAEPEASAEGAT